MKTVPERISSAATKIVLRLVAVLTLVLAGATGVAHGQTDYSLRMRALNTVLSGIIDDAISDAYRNPARVGGVSVDGAQVYGGLLPDRSFALALPEHESSFYAPVPEEGFYLYQYYPYYLRTRSYKPLSFSLFTRLRDSMPLSASVEVSVNGDDELSEDSAVRSDYFPIIEDIEKDDFGTSRGQEVRHLLVDLALAGSTPRADSRSTGLRMTVRYDSYKWHETSTHQQIEAPIENPAELESDIYAWMQTKEFDEFDASLRFGLFRSGSTLRELVAGIGVTRQTGSGYSGQLDIYDEDYDGNGVDPYGFRPAYTYERSLFESNRDYRALRGFGSAVFELGSKVRTKHDISWSEGYGEGAALYRVDDEIYDGFVDELYNESVDNTFDGGTRRYTLSSTIGFTDEVFDGVSFAAGTHLRYSHTEFEENADGDADVSYVRPDTTFTMDTPFHQLIRYEFNGLFLHVPASVEWRVNSYFELRLGLVYSANRREIEGVDRQTADLLGVQIPSENLNVDEDHDIVYSTGVSSLFGFTVNLKDKLVLDFLDSSPNHIGFSHVTLRYTF